VTKYPPLNGDNGGMPAVSASGNTSLIAQLSLANLRGVVWRQKVLILGVVLLSLAVAFAITLLTTPVYQASATIQVEPSQQIIIEGQELTDRYASGNEYSRYMETIATILRSRSLAQTVVDNLDLAQNEKFQTEILGLEQGVDGAESEAALVSEASAALQQGIEVLVPLENRVMTINFQSTDPALAAAIANGYAEAFLNFRIDRSTEANTYAREYLEEQIEELRLQLQDAETRANSFARNNRIVGQPLTVPSGGGEGGSGSGTAATLTAADLTNINQAYSEARARRIESQQRWLAMADMPAAQLAEVQQSSAITAFQAQLAQMNSELSTLRERYREDYPEIRELRARISQVETRMEAAAADIKRTIRNQYEIDQRQEAALAREVERVADLTLDEQDRRVAFGSIDREVEAYRDQLDALLQRYNQISSASNIRTSDTVILDPAIVPARPFAPNLSQNLLVALILGIGLAVGLALAREFFDDRLRSSEEVESKLGVVALGQIPFARGDVTDEIKEPFSPISEAYSSLRATVDLQLASKANPVLAVTSTGPGEGKTTTSLALARKYALLGRRVLLVDLDLRRPGVAKAAGIARTETGLVDVLFGRARLEDVVVPGVLENLHLLVSGPISNNPVEILSSGLVAEFLARNRTSYDVIVLDCSPVLGIADAPLVARQADGVVLVVEANNARIAKFRNTLRRLFESGAPILGVVVTKYKARESGESTSDQYSYYTYGAEER
jgi:polysaccharide biosynthesis transport protein